jgi:bla regulator protein blaR1
LIAPKNLNSRISSVNGTSRTGVYCEGGTVKRILAVISGALVSMALVFAQALDTAKPKFEVASVKPSTGGNNFIGIGRQPGGRFNANNVPLRLLIQNAYRVRDFQVIGGPSWMATDRWNIEARAEEGSIPPQTGPPDPNIVDPMSLRVQSLLEDRFQLKLHRETRELPIYTLTIAKDGVKMKSVDAPPRLVPGQGGGPPPPPPPPPAPGGGPAPNFTPPPGSVMMGPGSLIGSAMSIAQLVNSLSGLVGRNIIDKTDLNGFFDVRLQFAPETAAGTPFGGPGGLPGPPPSGGGIGPAVATDPSAPAIFTAIQEQLGLKLDSTRGAVDVIVIDSVQKPSEN